MKLPSSLRRDDQDIAQAIAHQFEWNVQVPDKKVKATVEDGWVTLKGEVEWAFQRNAAEKCVRGLAGVHGVTNAMSIKPSLDLKAPVKRKIEEALKREAVREATKSTLK